MLTRGFSVIAPEKALEIVQINHEDHQIRVELKTKQQQVFRNELAIFHGSCWNIDILDLGVNRIGATELLEGGHSLCDKTSSLVLHAFDRVK
jgi:hypothetical protein